MIKCYPPVGKSTDILGYFASCEGLNIIVYGIPQIWRQSEVQELVPLQRFCPELFAKTLHIVRSEIDRSDNEVKLKICGADFDSNIHIWSNFEHTDTIIAAHCKAISDIQFMSMNAHQPSLITSCSFDGTFKIWDTCQSLFTPVYEHFSSKKWLYSSYFDPTISSIFLNQEGKNCPQKILHINGSQFELNTNCPEAIVENELLVLRQYKLFNETILQTSSHISNDFMFITGVNGVVYRLTKRDVARLVNRHKEKLKGNLAKKVLQVKRSISNQAEMITLDFREDAGENMQE